MLSDFNWSWAKCSSIAAWAASSFSSSDFPDDVFCSPASFESVGEIGLEFDSELLISGVGSIGVVDSGTSPVVVAATGVGEGVESLIVDIQAINLIKNKYECWLLT